MEEVPQEGVGQIFQMGELDTFWHCSLLWNNCCNYDFRI